MAPSQVVHTVPCGIGAPPLAAANAPDIDPSPGANAITFDDGSTATGVTYLATADNEAYLGEASELEIARHICRSAGPSGANSDYLLELAVALRALGLQDAHIFEIEAHIQQIEGCGETQGE